VKVCQARANACVVVDLHPRVRTRAGDPSKPFCVEVGKADGVRWVPFQRYSSLNEAVAIRDRLIEVGCPARVIEFA
jgi:hypothetical protein